MEVVHGRFVEGRRVRALAGHLSELIGDADEVLDVGCGSGEMARAILDRRPGLRITGTDVVVRPETHIPVVPFADDALPQADRSVPVVLISDVLHHDEDPMRLLSEVARVARDAVVIKDVLLSDPLADRTLRFMDIVANRRYEVPLPFSFWTREQWRDAFERLGLRPVARRARLGLYPLPAALLFERNMHFITRLERVASAPA